MNNQEILVGAIKKVDVVISAVGATQLADQVKIIEAIKEAGNVKASYQLINFFTLFLLIGISLNPYFNQCMIATLNMSIFMKNLYVLRKYAS